MLLDYTALALALAAAFATAALLRWLERRLPLWLARRLGPPETPQAAALLTWRRRIGVAMLLPKIALWSAALILASQRLQPLMSARDDLAQLVSASLMAPLVRMGERAWSALDLLELPLLLGLLWLAVGVVIRILRAQLTRAGGPEWSGVDQFTALARYALLGLGALVLLQVWGFDLSSLALLGGVLGIGIGFGLQDIARNFVSGLLLSFERPIKPGDFVSLGDLSGTVRQIGARSTEVLTPDHVSILVPNSRFLEREVVNWSHGNPLCKLHAPVGVAYGSDVARVRAALLEAASGHPKVVADPRPTVDLEAFGDSALLFDLEVWTREPQNQQELKSALNYRIEASLRRHGIEVPYPQRDLHLRSPELRRVLDAWSRRAFPELMQAATGATRDMALPGPSPHEPELEPSPNGWSAEKLGSLAERMRAPGGVCIADRRHRLSAYPRCCVGSEVVDWLVKYERITRKEAADVGQRMLEQGLLRHVLDEHAFEDGYLFYRFAADEELRAVTRGPH